ncbi:MAG: hypothetical protein JSS72_04470 [Armatimonadetes bacterium]|nr:hypothetical protein [Armatimonadota bacterium]
MNLRDKLSVTLLLGISMIIMVAVVLAGSANPPKNQITSEQLLQDILDCKTHEVYEHLDSADRATLTEEQVGKILEMTVKPFVSKAKRFSISTDDFAHFNAKHHVPPGRERVLLLSVMRDRGGREEAHYLYFFFARKDGFVTTSVFGVMRNMWLANAFVGGKDVTDRDWFWKVSVDGLRNTIPRLGNIGVKSMYEDHYDHRIMPLSDIYAVYDSLLERKPYVRAEEAKLAEQLLWGP